MNDKLDLFPYSVNPVRTPRVIFGGRPYRRILLYRISIIFEGLWYFLYYTSRGADICTA